MITKQNLIDALQKMEERGITHGYNSTTDMFRMFIAYLPNEKIEPKKPEVEQTIGPRHYAPPVDVKVKPEWEKCFIIFEEALKLHTLDMDLLKRYIRTEIIEKICEEILEALKEEPWRYDFSLAASAEKPVNIVKARWLKGE